MWPHADLFHAYLLFIYCAYLYYENKHFFFPVKNTWVSDIPLLKQQKRPVILAFNFWQGIRK